MASLKPINAIVSVDCNTCPAAPDAWYCGESRAILTAVGRTGCLPQPSRAQRSSDRSTLEDTRFQFQEHLKLGAGLQESKLRFL